MPRAVASASLLLDFDVGGCPMLRRSRFFDLLREIKVELVAVVRILL